MINPPSNGKGRYWATENGGAFENAEEWRKNTKQREGSWWEDWTKWLEEHSGEKVEPPRVGSEKYPPIEDTPGTYVRGT